MSIPAKKTFDASLVHLADIAKVLSHPVRLRILQILAVRRECICGDIVELLPLAQSTVSQHLKELKKIGLIRGKIEGPKISYCLNPQKLIEAIAVFSDYFKIFIRSSA